MFIVLVTKEDSKSNVINVMKLFNHDRDSVKDAVWLFKYIIVATKTCWWKTSIGGRI